MSNKFMSICNVKQYKEIEYVLTSLLTVIKNSSITQPFYFHEQSQ